MKIDQNKTLEEQGFIKTRTGRYKNKKNNRYYYLKKSCLSCGKSFLASKKNVIYCCLSCSNIKQWSDPNNIRHSEKVRQKMIKSIEQKWQDPNSKYNSDEFRQKKSETLKKLWQDPNSKYNSDEFRQKKSETLKKLWQDPNYREKFSNENSLLWRGGYYAKGIPTYDVYASQIEWCEEVRRNKEDPNVLEVKCFKCKKWYVPNYDNVANRLQSIKGNSKGEYHFYCSERCKNSCSVFNKSPEQLMKQDAVRAGRLPWLELTREVQPELRQMVLERDGHKCVKCNDSNNLQCHHIYPVITNPLESADVDNCITLCKECHKKIHQEVDGCSYDKLRNIGVC